MSKQYDNTNRGALFKNEDKQKETHADYQGNLNVDGVEYFLDAWVKEAASGRKFMSVSVKRKDKQAPALAAPAPAARPKDERYRAGQPARQATGFDDMDDDIPF